MALPENVIRQRLKQAGIAATDQQVTDTTELYNMVTAQLDAVAEDSLHGVEPHYIQPTRLEGTGD